ncbi:MAG: hypothetical protein HY313_08240 [Acidobacteria bacterium]|nr:hypothetical protein [Acidobacteriota bacterium]
MPAVLLHPGDHLLQPALLLRARLEAELLQFSLLRLIPGALPHQAPDQQSQRNCSDQYEGPIPEHATASSIRAKSLHILVTRDNLKGETER